MRTGDFTDDVFGNSAAPIINPNVGGAPNVFFQCDGSGNPLPANPDGSQAAGTNCNKIPSGLINPIAQQMINLYPLPNASNQTFDYNYASVPVRKLNEKKFDVKLDHTFSGADSLMARFSYDQANSYVPGGAPGFAESNAFASNQGIINHGRNVVVSETHIFPWNTVNQFTAGYSRIFNYITSQGTGSCESAILGIPGANLRSEERRVGKQCR